MTEARLEELRIEVKNLKVSLYSLIEGYRKLIHIAQMEQERLVPLCKVTTGVVDADGSILVGKEVLQALSEKIVLRCLEESAHYIDLFHSVDKFVMGMLDYVDILKTLHTHNSKNMKLLCECWCGDKYDGQSKKNGLRCLSEHFKKLAERLSLEMFKNMFYEVQKNGLEEEEIGYLNIFEE